MKISNANNKQGLSDFDLLIQKAKTELLLSDEEISKLSSIKLILNDQHERHLARSIIWISFLFLLLIGLPVSVVWSMYNGTVVGNYFAKVIFKNMVDPDVELHESECLFPAYEFINDKFRAPVDCSECASVKGVKKLENLSPDDFLNNYAFSMQPILVEDGQNNWTASQTFDYFFFRDVYNDSETLKKITRECQFFPYRTELKSLEEFFNMSKGRVEGMEAPWYVGWSNCDGKTANILREHYKVPYFLPKYLDQSSTDWIFMGLPGYGAHMHIDNVGTLSWQAQIKGTKKWTLQSPPECYGQCISEMEIIVKPGQIIVLDTNKWFHQTEIIGNDTSIVIGSEYY